jgi:glycerol-3-phosphate dehydrogenase
LQRNLDAFRDTTFDLLVLGGGITGAGIALDAVLRGLRVALIDRADFGGGTSSASSKLVHGGLRYLEHGDVHLVFEALQERRLLLRNAPHLVRPLRFVLPFYRGSRVPPWKWHLGLTAYDLLAGSGNLRPHRTLSRWRLRHDFPDLQTHGLSGGAEYYDAQMDDARLCLEVLRTAALHGAGVANYVEAIAFEQREGAIHGVRAIDRRGGQELRISARQVVNATGPWVDEVCRLAGDTSGPHLRPTKGVHLLAPCRGLTAAFLLLHPADGRVFFVIPWLGKTLIGTTDTLCDETSGALTVTEADIAYLLEAFNHYFVPGLKANEVLGSFAGLRPLIRERSGEPSALSREFRISRSGNGLLSVAGGKYTTYRHMAEVVTDAVVARLGGHRTCRTRHVRLDGAPTQPWAEYVRTEAAALRSQHGLEDEAAQHLLHRYGRRARDVAAYVRRDPGLGRPIVAGEPDLYAEFVYQREQEMAVCPEDCLLRRTRLGLYRPELLREVPRPLVTLFPGSSS